MHVEGERRASLRPPLQVSAVSQPRIPDREPKSGLGVGWAIPTGSQQLARETLQPCAPILLAYFRLAVNLAQASALTAKVGPWRSFVSRTSTRPAAGRAATSTHAPPFPEL